MFSKMTSKQLKENWSDGHKYTDSQIRRILCKYGLLGRRTAKEPNLSKRIHIHKSKQTCTLKNQNDKNYSQGFNLAGRNWN